MQTTDDGVSDLVHSLSLVYDDHAGLVAAGGIALDRAVHGGDFTQGGFTFTNVQYDSGKSSFDFFFSDVGSQYDPVDESGTSAGTTTYSAQAARRFGNVNVDASSQSSRDDAGALQNSQDRLRMSLELNDRFSMNVSTSANYAGSVGAYNANGLGLSYGQGDTNASASYDAGRYQYGFLQDARLAGAFALPLIGSLRLEHRETTFTGEGAPRSMQQSSSASLACNFGKKTSASIGYRHSSGDLPGFLPQSAAAGGAVSFSFDRYLKAGLLHLSVNRDMSAFGSPPSFSIKLVPGSTL